MNKKTNNLICFVAGHSGGHIIPCITQAQKELQKDSNLEILFFTTKSKLDNNILHQYSFIKYKINLPVENIPAKLSKKIIFSFQLLYSFIKSFFILKKFKPKKIVSMGGLISVPVCFAAKLLKIEIELWELNVEPGKTVKFLAKFVKKINICFEDTQQYFKNNECNLVNYPIRFISKNLDKIQALTKINLSANRKTILIIGGSQGSVFINNLIKLWIENNLSIAENIQIIHQTGNTDFNWNTFYKQLNIPAIVFSFSNEIDIYYQASDLIICRSGAGTLAEILFFEKRCITIPLNTKTTSHQILNAKSLVKKYPNLFDIFNQTENQNQFFLKVNNYLDL